MKLQKAIFLLFLLQTLCGKLSAFENDTLRLNPIIRKKAYYQPLVLKISPTAFLFGGFFPYTSEYRFSVEITSARTQSEQLSVSLLDKNVLLAAAATVTKTNYKADGWRVQYAHKFYIVRKKRFAPYGLYAGALISYANAEISMNASAYYRNEYLQFRNFNINGIVGIQVGKYHRLTLDVYTGLGYKKNKVFTHYANGTLTPYATKDFGELFNSPVNGVFGINLGYSL
ncbi:MAG TPA: hypothetical protein VFF27_12610 [Bacteroidia bacterium]|jgi:hypothetical protein|nr:hypothetical protein [Bacteroidia bacterium]